MEDVHVGGRITAKVFRGGRAYVEVDGFRTLYRRAEKIAVEREG
jgi:hypothetical protein